MEQQFYDFVKAFLEAGEIECPPRNAESIIKVDLGGYEFYFALLEQSKAIILQGVVGIIPVNNTNIYKKLLKMNNLFSKTQGATLGIDEDIITLQRRIEIEGLTSEIFTTKAEEFLNGLFNMLHLFSQPFEDMDESTDSNEPTDTDVLHAMQTMIRI